MPLPPAPSRRAALLAPEAFEVTARPRVATTSANEPVAAPQRTAAAPARAGRKADSVASALAAPEAAPLVQVETRARTPEPVTAPVARSTGTRKARSTSAAAAVTPSTAPAAATTTRARKSASQGPTKLFVLDTNVLLHDPTSLFRFEEHDIFLPMIVLEELDGHKKGMTEVARNGRQASRTLDALAAAQGADMAKGLKLDSTGQRAAGGHLFFQTVPLDYSLPTSLPPGKADNQILGVVEALRKLHAPREVVLVSKDINMRVKARALGLATDDYQNDKTLEDGDLLYSGALALPADFWARHGKTVESWQSGSHTFYRITGPVVPSLLINQFVYFEAPGEPKVTGQLDFQLWSEFEGGRLGNSLLAFGNNHLIWKDEVKGEPHRLDLQGGKIQLRRDGEAWQLASHDVTFKLDGATWLHSRLLQSASMRSDPQLAAGSSMPRPRKLRKDSSRMTAGIVNVR